MPPKEIVILRHGEKPGDPSQDKLGEDPNLSPRGYARAAALAYLLPEQFGNPGYLFATDNSDSSNRPVETITPLANKLGLSIDHKFSDKHYADLAKLLLTSTYSGQFLVVCWHHGTIPALATALGVLNVPSHWPGSVFDRYWQITFPNGQATLANLPQQVLYGDSAT